MHHELQSVGIVTGWFYVLRLVKGTVLSLKSDAATYLCFFREVRGQEQFCASGEFVEDSGFRSKTHGGDKLTPERNVSLQEYTYVRISVGNQKEILLLASHSFTHSFIYPLPDSRIRSTALVSSPGHVCRRSPQSHKSMSQPHPICSYITLP